jgi:hypothetical protein
MQLITNQFVLVAPDCKATTAVVPSRKGGKETVPVIQHELLTTKPYTLTLEDLIFETHVRRLGLTAAEAKARKKDLWRELFAKSHACMRASALPKQYGWGVNYDAKPPRPGADGVGRVPPVRGRRGRRGGTDAGDAHGLMIASGSVTSAQTSAGRRPPRHDSRFSFGHSGR